jgi:adenosylhomocysteine nucleosidase
VAGTLSDKLSVGDIAVADDVVQHDMDTSPLGDPVGLISGLNMVHMPSDTALADAVCAAIEKTGGNWLRGTIASGDVFVADAAKKTYIRDNFGAIACEMEGAAIGHVCTVNHVPFVVIRAISDGGNEDSPMDYPTFVKIAAARSADVVQCLLRDM